MNSTVSVAKYCLFAAAAGACAFAIALWPPQGAVPDQGSMQQGTGYLDCGRVLSERVLEPDLVAPCSLLA